MKNTQKNAELFIRKEKDHPYDTINFREIAELMVNYADEVCPKPVPKKKGPHQVDPVNIDREIGKHVG